MTHLDSVPHKIQMHCVPNPLKQTYQLHGLIIASSKNPSRLRFSITHWRKVIMSDFTEDFFEESPPFEIFNGFRLIDAHLQERKIVENFVRGHATDCDLPEDVCHRGCLFSEWFQSAEEKSPDDQPLFDQLCESCDDVYKAATQAVLFKKTGDEIAAQALLGDHSKYAELSEKFQEHVLTLHDKLHAQYRQVENWADDEHSEQKLSDPTLAT